jgi:hypothetical protein
MSENYFSKNSWVYLLSEIYDNIHTFLLNHYDIKKQNYATRNEGYLVVTHSCNKAVIRKLRALESSLGKHYSGAVLSAVKFLFGVQECMSTTLQLILTEK